MVSVSNLPAGADAAAINKATVGSLSSSATSLVSSGPASALSSLGDTVSDALQPVTSVLQELTGSSKLPLPNILASYATYNYILGLAVLTADQYNNATYIKGAKPDLICKSAHIDPNNRVNTAYGKFDFYIDNLELGSNIQNVSGDFSHITTLSFDIIEPYSMGIFLLALQTAALKAGWSNWNQAPFLLTVEFKGNKETGQMLSVPNSSRSIPINLTTISTKVNQSGTTYHCGGHAAAGEAHTEKYANLRTDVAIKGTTVQEALQTGEKSLQSVVNTRLRQYKVDKVVDVPDEILILFPKNVDSTSDSPSDSKTNNSATVNPTSKDNKSDLNSKLGVTRSQTNHTLVQDKGSVNVFGSANLGFDENRKADTPISDDDLVYDPKTNIWHRGKTNINVKENNFKFAQDSTIKNAINQVILMSEYPNKALDSTNLDDKGRRVWWQIDTQVYYVPSDENLSKTGTYAKLIVYRVIPKKVQASVKAAPNAKVKGFDQLKKSVVKQYDYLYTGKNSEIIRFDIDFNLKFAQQIQADNYKQTQDVQTQSKTSEKSEFPVPEFLLKLVNPLTEGMKPSTTLGSVPTQVRVDATTTNTDKKGGGGAETAVTRAARGFQDALNNPNNMVELNMEIIGDPFWISQSGMGTYNAAPTSVKNVGADSAVHHQTEEVDILVNFRTPVDINQATGMYNFGGSSKSAPVIQFSGLYQIQRIKSFFKQGRFTQELHGFRRPNQENKEAASDVSFSSIASFFGFK